MKKIIPLLCLALVLSIASGVLLAYQMDEPEPVKLVGRNLFIGKIIYISKAPVNILLQYPNSYIIYLETPDLYTEELAEILVTEDTVCTPERWSDILNTRHVGSKIEAYTYDFTGAIDQMHARLYVAQSVSLMNED